MLPVDNSAYMDLDYQIRASESLRDALALIGQQRREAQRNKQLSALATALGQAQSPEQQRQILAQSGVPDINQAVIGNAVQQAYKPVDPLEQRYMELRNKSIEKSLADNGEISAPNSMNELESVLSWQEINKTITPEGKAALDKIRAEKVSNIEVLGEGNEFGLPTGSVIERGGQGVRLVKQGMTPQELMAQQQRVQEFNVANSKFINTSMQEQAEMWLKDTGMPPSKEAVEAMRRVAEASTSGKIADPNDVKMAYPQSNADMSKVGSMQDIVNEISDLKGFVDENSNIFGPLDAILSTGGQYTGAEIGERKAEFNSRLTILTAEFARLRETGVLTEGDVNRYRSALQGIEGAKENVVKSALGSIEDSIKLKLDAYNKRVGGNGNAQPESKNLANDAASALLGNAQPTTPVTQPAVQSAQPVKPFPTNIYNKKVKGDPSIQPGEAYYDPETGNYMRD